MLSGKNYFLLYFQKALSESKTMVLMP